MDDVTKLYELLLQHKWIPLAAIVIALVVRLLKSDTKIPIDIPPRWRLPLATVLGAAVVVLEKVAGGADWKQAAVDGVGALFFAVYGHNLVIDTLRGGKEFNIPGLIVPGATPGPDAPPTIPPGKGPTIPPVTMALMLLGALLLAGCAKAFQVVDILADKAKCVVANQDLPNDKIFAKCAVEPGDVPKYLDLLAESREAAKRAVSASRTGASERSDAGCAGDAGLR